MAKRFFKWMVKKVKDLFAGFINMKTSEKSTLCSTALTAVSIICKAHPALSATSILISAACIGYACYQEGRDNTERRSSEQLRRKILEKESISDKHAQISGSLAPLDPVSQPVDVKGCLEATANIVRDVSGVAKPAAETAAEITKSTKEKK